MVTKVASDRQGIQSIEVGFRLLSVLAATNRPMMLRDIAKGASMPAAKAHRYMVSFLRIGIVEAGCGQRGATTLGLTHLNLGYPGLGDLILFAYQDRFWKHYAKRFRETVALAVLGKSRRDHCPDHRRRRARNDNPPCRHRTPTLQLRHRPSFFQPSTDHPSLKRCSMKNYTRSPNPAKPLLQTIRRQLEKSLTEIRARGIGRATGSLDTWHQRASVPPFTTTQAVWWRP
jgi:DNA-binding IclR family transcriptional regulator